MFFAKIPRHTSQNAITEGDLREQRVKVKDKIYCNCSVPSQLRVKMHFKSPSMMAF